MVYHSPIRRKLLKSMGAAVLAAPYLMKVRRATASDPVVMVSWGGSFQEIFKRVVAEPFTQSTGIPVEIVAGPDMAKAKAQVMTGNIEWDVIDTSGPQAMSGEFDNLWEPLDINVIDVSGLTIPATKTAIPYFHYAGGVGYVPGRTPNPPKNFTELWDVETFPGRRGFRQRPHQTYEMALIADGVSVEDVYPLDIERAYKSLERIKPHVTQWIPQTPQTISLLQTNEIDYVFAFNGRVEAAKQAGMDIAFSTEQNLLLTEYLAVLRGSPKREDAMRFIAFAMRPEIQAEFSSVYHSIPTRHSALELVNEDVRASLPDFNNSQNLVLNDKWWAENWTAQNQRFSEWLMT